MRLKWRVLPNMSTVYIAKAYIPSTSANSVHVMKISEAFSEIDSDFRLIIPEPKKGKEDIERSFAIYGVKPFLVDTVSITRTGMRNRYGFAIKSVLKAGKAQKIITRDPIVAFLSVLLHKHTVLDLHGDLAHLCGRAYRIIRWKWFRDNSNLHLVMITRGLADYYQRKYDVPPERMTVLADGYTDSNFCSMEKRAVLKDKKLNIGYCGGFVKGKGLELIYRLAQKDTGNKYHLYGGLREDAEKEVGGLFSDNVSFGGYIPNAKVPEVLNEQDILLLPNQKQQICKNEDIGMVTSPLKMFEYMASGRVIVASDISVLREVLNEDNSFLVEADAPEKWAETIAYIASHREEAVKRADKAAKDVKEYTWSRRAEQMIMLCKTVKIL